MRWREGSVESEGWGLGVEFGVWGFGLGVCDVGFRWWSQGIGRAGVEIGGRGLGDSGWVGMDVCMDWV
jgi:hypothetical protein